MTVNRFLLLPDLWPIVLGSLAACGEMDGSEKGRMERIESRVLRVRTPHVLAMSATFALWQEFHAHCCNQEWS